MSNVPRRHYNHVFRLSKVFLLAWLLAFGMSAASSAALDQTIRNGQEALYQGNFDQAVTIFNGLIANAPEDPKGYFFLALTYRWLTRIDPGSLAYQQHFEKTMRASIKLCEALLKKNAHHRDALLYLAASYGYRAEYYNFLKHDWNDAYNDGVNMRKYLEQAKKTPHITRDLDLGYGLYNYYADLYSADIGWWRFLLSLPRGDKAEGLQQLEAVKTQGEYARVEAWYFLIELYKEEKQTKDRAIELNEALVRQYPGNPYFHTLLAGVYHKHHDWQNSTRVAQEILAQAQNHKYYTEYLVYQAKYLIGESFFFQGKHQESLRQFDDIIQSQPQYPAYLLPWAHLRRGTIYQLTGQADKATTEYQVVLKMKNVQKVHELAEGLLKNQPKK